jgi:hypothetical protein
MRIDPEQFSAITNALQAALMLAVSVESDVKQAARDAGDVRAAVERAAVAAQTLRAAGEEKS